MSHRLYTVLPHNFPQKSKPCPLSTNLSLQTLKRTPQVTYSESEELWRVGDKCMAPYSGDSEYYRASIQTLSRSSQGHTVASVRFSGFTEEDDEIIDVRKLKKRPVRTQRGEASTVRDSGSTAHSSSSDVTSPLKYVSEEERLRTKYADLFETFGSPVAKSNKLKHLSPSSISSSSASSPGATVSRCGNKRKNPVAVGGELKDVVIRHKRSPVSSLNQAPSPVAVRQPIDQDSFSFLDEGFSCEELEKPYFPGVSNASAKVPLVLSQGDSDSLIQVPATINRYLRDYQREGVKFLYRRYQKREGGILGDDMGLGKTVQVLAFLCAVLRKTGTKEDCQRRLPEFLQKKMTTSSKQSSKVFLIICPTSVLHNWLDEFDTWTYCTVGKYHGRERQETLWKAMKGKLDAVITSYETYRIYMESLLKVKWAGVIVDEVHKIKEPGSLITQALKDIDTTCRFGLTGTALQNKLSELWCVLDWANPDCLGSLADFKMKFEDAISKGQKFHASKRELAESRRVSQEFAALRDKWMLRRTKSLIQDQLPTKEEQVVFCKLTELQLSIYKALLESDDMQLVLRQKEKCDCGSQQLRMHCCYRYNAEGEKVKSLTMTFMSLMIKVANHIALLTPDVAMSDKQRKRAQKYCDIAFSRYPQFITLSREARFCTLSDPSYCGKMQILEKLLIIFKREGSKVLVFSYYTQLLNIIEMYLKSTDYVYRRLDGKTPAQERQKYVHEFNRDRDIFLFLISTKAGGLGLNLTGANVVIIFDPNWNPTYDLQAQDRAYRIGQHRDVRVYRLISTGSIEENMYLRQVYKQQLASAAVTSENPMRYFTAVAGDKKQQGELFGLQNMFALRPDTSCLTKDLIQRHVKTEEGITMAKYIAPSPSDTDTNQIPEKEEAEVKDDDSDSSHSNDDITNEDINDDHGVSSQFLSESVSSDDDSEDNDKIKRRTVKHLKPPVEMEETKTGNPPDKSTAQPNRKLVISEPSSDEDTDRRRTRGKAILRRDGRIEHRAKNLRNVTTESSSRDKEIAKRSKVAILKSDGHRTGKDEKNRQKNLKTTNAVEDVFKECGVAFIHSNMKIVGGSRVEDHVSNIAMRDVYDLGLNSQQPANYNVPTLQESNLDSPIQETESSNQSEDPLHELLLAQSQPASHRMNGTTVLFGQTPRGIRRQQFEAMAKRLKKDSSADFARYVLSLSQEGYSELLKDYYASKHPGLNLDKLYKPPEVPEHEEKQGTRNNSKRGDNGRSTRRPQTERCRSKKWTSKGCQFDSLSDDGDFGNDPSLQTRSGGRKNELRSRGQPLDDARNLDAEDGESRLLSRSRRNRASERSVDGTCRASRVLKSKGKTRGESDLVDDSSSTETEDDEVAPSTSRARPVSASGHNQKGIRTKPHQKQRGLNIGSETKTKRSVGFKKSGKKGSRLIDAIDEEWLTEDVDHSKKARQPSRTKEIRDRKDYDKKDSQSDRSGINSSSTPASLHLHQEGNLSFLDDIFLPEHSQRPPKPPPKKKSPRVQPTTIFPEKVVFTDSDIEMEDVSDVNSYSVSSFSNAGPHQDSDQEVASTLWRRNSKFSSRQSALEQASPDTRSVFEKYAESFVPNEHFVKRHVDKTPKINVRETSSSQESDDLNRPSTSLIPETPAW